LTQLKNPIIQPAVQAGALESRTSSRFAIAAQAKKARGSSARPRFSVSQNSGEMQTKAATMFANFEDPAVLTQVFRITITRQSAKRMWMLLKIISSGRARLRTRHASGTPIG